MKKTLIVVGLLFCGVAVSAQLKTDPQSIFKMFLFLNRSNVSFRGMDKRVSKNDSLYKAFSEVTYLKLNKLKVLKNRFEKQTAVPEFDYYELKMYDTAKKDYTNNVTYKRTLTSNEGQFFGVYIGGCDEYIIAINRTTGDSYRLKGFNINDFLAFFVDFKEVYTNQSYTEKGEEHLNIRKFLKNYQIEDLDFECLYDGLTSKEIDRDKYPCLKRVADITPAY